MGWLEGVLTGYANRHYAIEEQKRQDAATAAEREGLVLKSLLDSEYPEIKNYAAAGILDLANPRRRKGGIAGWMGEIEKSPYLDMIRRAQEHIESDPEYARAQLGRTGPQETPGVFPPQPSVPPTTGSVPNPQSAAQPSTNLVEGGPTRQPTPAPTPPGGPPAPPAPVTAVGPSGFTPGAQPAPGGPPVPNAMAPNGLAGPPLPPLPSPPPPPPQPAAAGLPDGTTHAAGRQPPPPPQRTILQPLPGIFPSQADLRRQQARATVGGKLDEYVALYQAQGFDDATAHAKAAALLERDIAGTSGARRYQVTRAEWTDPTTMETIRGLVSFDAFTGKYLLPDGSPAPTDMHVIPTGRLQQPIEAAAQAMGFNSANEVPTERFNEMFQMAQQIDAAITTNRTDARQTAVAMGTLSPTQANTLHVPYGTQGRALSGQIGPTPAERTRRISIQNIRAQVEGLKPLVEAALPHDADLTGLAPNLVSGVWERTTRRNEFAALNQRINSVINTLARSVDEQKGAQTEQDAARARESLVALGNGLTDPLGGDTVESAQIRLAQTLVQLDMVLANIPQDYKPVTPPPATNPNGPVTLAPGVNPSVPPKGFYRDPATGKRYLDGKEF